MDNNQIVLFVVAVAAYLFYQNQRKQEDIYVYPI